ncbi:tetratricopeptide repeat protein [Alphaproteobacteria bacterium]|nr:tetratricopeptide repeat protein [Alphaproteobacteria bacterium]
MTTSPSFNHVQPLSPWAQIIKELLSTALAHHQNSQFAAADFLYKKILKAEPNNVVAIQLSGVLAYQIQKFELSLNLLSRAISLKPDYAEALNNRGIVFKELRRFDEAIADYDKAISLKPDYVDALYNRGIIFKELRRFDEAIADYDKTISLKPNHIEALNNRGLVMQELKSFDDAIADYDRAVSLKPDNVNALYNRGLVMQELKRFDEAMTDYDKAISLKPDYIDALNNRGLVLQELRRFDEAEANYDKAISLQPDYVDAPLNKALQLLLQGEFASGWEHYEWRWKATQLSSLARKFAQPLWLGKEDLRDKTILLHWEQGLGDTIQFSRYAQTIANLGCKTILEVQEPLFELMTGIEGVDELIANGTDLPPFDFYCPLMSLPLALGTTLKTIPSATSYLRSTDDKLAKWSNRLGPKSKPRVGIMWSGNPIHKNDHNRSISLEKILDAVPEGFEIVSLQKEVRENDLNVLEHSKQVQHFGAELDDFTDTAAFCELMDVIVSVDTSVAHLAGALGKPVYLLLPYTPDFRWLLDRHDSPWYPSMTLLRQGPERLWEPVLDEVTVRLDHTECYSTS